MPGEDEELVFGLRYVGQDEVANLFNDLTKVEQALAELGSSVQRGSYASASTAALEAISGTLREQYSTLDAARARLAQANLQSKEVTRRTALTAAAGGPSADAAKVGGYSSEFQQLNASLAAFRSRQAAAKALDAEYGKATGAMRQSTQAQEALAKVGQIVQRGLAEQATAGTAAARGAEQLNIDQNALRRAIAARSAAEEAAARQAEAEAIQTSRLAAVDAELAARRPATYQAPDVNTEAGRLQASVNAAEINLELATRKLADERQSVTRTYESVRKAEATQEAAVQRLSSSEQSLSLYQQRQGGNAGQQFVTGFRGVTDRPYAEQFGQALKFSVLYGTAYRALFGITQTLQQALDEGIQFQQAMSELHLASGQSAQEMDGVRQQLAQAATAAGQAPSQGVLVGARSLGLFGLTSQSNPSASLRQQQDLAATISAQIVSKAAFSSGLQPTEIQPDLAAIAQAFNQGPQGQVRAYDLDAYLSRRFGVAPGSTYQAVSESATAGRASGFSQEQITAIAAELQARTGQDAGTIAGYMAQIFSRSGEGALTNVEQKYGVNTAQDLADQIKALAKVYAQTPSARDEISAVFGRGKSQNASIALLQGFPDIQAAAKAAQTNATGAGDNAFNIRISNVGGQLAILGGDLKSLESDLGRSGLLDTVGVLIKSLDELVTGIDGILQVWDKLDGVTKGLIATILLEETVRRNAGFLGDVFGGSGGAHAAGVPLAGEAGAAEGAAAGGAAGSRLLRAGQIAGILASIVVIGNTLKANTNLKTSTSDVTNLLNNPLSAGASSQTLQSRASALQLEADQATKSAHGIFSWFIDRGNELAGGKAAATTAIDAADAAHTESLRLQKLARQEQAQQAATPTGQSLISGFDADSLSQSLQGITLNGGNANDRLNALAASLERTADGASRARAAFDPRVFAGQQAGGLFSQLRATGFVGQSNPDNRVAAIADGLSSLAGRGPISALSKTTNALPGAISQYLSPTDVQNRLRQGLAQRGVTSLNDIGPRVAGQLAQGVVGNTPEEALKSLGITDPSQIAKLRDMMVNQVKDSLLKQAKAVHDIISGNARLSGSEQTSTVGTITSDTQAALGTLQQTDYQGRVDTLRRQVQLIQAAIRATPTGATSSTQDALNQAQIQLADAQISQLDDMRKAAQSRAKTQAEVASVGKAYLTRELRVAINAGDNDALANLISQSGTEGIAIARSIIQQALTTARAAEQIEAQIQAFAASEVAGIRGMINRPGATAGSGQSPAVARLQGLLKTISQSVVGSQKDNPFATGSDAGQASQFGTSTAAQIAAARQSALAAGSESQISQARAAMATARADMAAAKKGTTDYYSALSAYLTARDQLTTAIQSYNQNLFLLHHDATNPVVQAQAAVNAAAAKLRSDAGKPGDVTAADRVALQNAQSQLEATRFQQRLDAVQTAEQLGQTSFTAYIRYLDHERDRLEAIKHRSYQQQQELNQVDQLLQTAAQTMQGEWNFGDITLPKPYQVQRYIQSQLSSGIGIGGAGSSTQTNTIYVDGADTRAVLKIIRDVLGANVTLTTTKPHKRGG